MQKAMNFNAIASVKVSYYTIHFLHMSKDDAINIMKNPNLDKKVDHCNFFLLYTKMSELTYYERNRETILSKAK